jgi:hypothetical protein
MDESGMTKSHGEHNRPENPLSYKGRFVRYHPVTVTSNIYPYTELSGPKLTGASFAFSSQVRTSAIVEWLKL